MPGSRQIECVEDPPPSVVSDAMFNSALQRRPDAAAETPHSPPSATSSRHFSNSELIVRAASISRAPPPCIIIAAAAATADVNEADALDSPRRACSSAASAAAAAAAKASKAAAAEPQRVIPDLRRRSYWRARSRSWWLLGRFFPGVHLPEALACVLLGVLLIFAVPRPAELTPRAWGLFGLFAATILGLVLRPVPMGGVCLVAVSIALWSGLMTFSAAFSAFEDRTVWLIVSALLMAEAVEKTGLGCRCSLLFIRACGGTSLGLTYALMGADLLLAMGMPSTTAREGGVFLPIIRGIAQTFGSYPDDKPSSKLLGSFLMMSQLQHTQPTSAMWLTGAAPNTLALGLARSAGVALPAGDWVLWVKGSCVPALALMAITPLAVYALFPPRIKKTPEAPVQARKALAGMGPLSYGEAATLAVMVFAVTFWICGGYIKAMPQLNTTAVALMALSLLLLAGVLTWEDCLAAAFAWDILFWLSILMSMSTALTKAGVNDWLASRIASRLQAAGIAPVGVFILVLSAYVALHYLFASQSAHVAALFTPFLHVLLACGVSPVLAAMSLAYIGNAITGMTHYASAESVIYAASRYYSVRSVWGVGAVMTVLNVMLWIGIGLGWWKAVGFYTSIATMA